MPMFSFFSRLFFSRLFFSCPFCSCRGRSFRLLHLIGCVAVFAPLAGTYAASINAGLNKPSASKPFVETAVANFNYPWAIAVMPDGRMLVTEKPGKVFLVTQAGQKTELGGIPAVNYSGQDGLLDIAISPAFRQDRAIYLTYVEPGAGGGTLALASATLDEKQGGGGSLASLKVIWRANIKGGGGQPGGIIAFSPDGKYLFLTSGDRMRPQTAQDPDDARGKLLRLNLDGSTPSDNPFAKAGGVRAQTWTFGHRNPYGLAFAPDGTLWLHEMGPRGGDEFDLIKPGLNYGWPLVSYGINYDGTPIPQHDTRPEFEAPQVYWTPVIAPAGLAFYEGAMFPGWKGSALIGGLQSQGIVRVAFKPDGQVYEAERWNLGHRIRDVAVAPDGAVWLIEDEEGGRLVRLTKP